MTEDRRAIRSYGRIKSRPIKARQAGLVERDLPRLAFPLGADPRHLLSQGRDVWLEVGFGGGEHLAAQAARNPEALLIGAEPFLNGVASAVRHVHEQGLDNVRLHAGDVRELLTALPERSVDRVFILFPDPWPKVRHHKRRLVGPGFISELARVMRSGACLRFATDWRDYAAWTLQRLFNHNDFDWTAERADDWRIPPLDHVTTRYEDKRLGDTAPLFLEFTRR